MNMIQKRMEQRGQGGFTLIELLVVIAILAVLGGAVIIGIGAMRGNAEEQVCKTEKETIETAAEAFKTSDDSEAYPADVQALVTESYLKSGTISVNSWTVDGTTGAVENDGAYDDLDANCAP